ncbi:DUF4942 domain-containing protein [Burkholderia aenigmatica]|uniref:DUF4942 domain-containing protein n=1 Tax=Burkholderia aenigmatica TaxID=2015348 RepID=UPI002652F63C|nr:DUF4942 domain-containing protein [Burkholderia aenigmatica]MDN7880087.1 DUF4942 domain-containing protein [Burkholderia aenigmatica]
MNEVFDAGQSATFFAPVASDLFDTLIGQYNADHAKILEIGELAQGQGFRSAVSYFVAGNRTDTRGYNSLGRLEELFQVEGAVKALNSTYWQKALDLTDVLELMPQARRDEWSTAIREHTTPDFTEDAVRPTLLNLLSMRQQFLAEKIDGIFRGLSGEHVTNAPEAFGKRMIIQRVRTSYDTVNHSTAGLIHDLRCVIARFMGRDEARWSSTDLVLAECKANTGKWVVVDGGALRVRTYKNGNGHMEVHPDMAWRLNMMLAHLYPTAIPASFRSKPPKPRKEFGTLMRPLPFAVIEVLQGCLDRRRWAKNNDVSFGFTDLDRNGCARDEARRVLEAIGGTKGRVGDYAFDYRPDEVLREIVLSGCLPDRVAFQFYPTPESIVRVLLELADIQDGDTVLEPSAGQGAIAMHLPASRVDCVELSTLHCAILEARGFNTVNADFLCWSDRVVAEGRRYSKIVMNPPFSDGRARLHVEQAFKLLSPGGRLVSVVPASMRGMQFLPGVEIGWSRVYENEFKGTTAAVAIMTVEASEQMEISRSNVCVMEQSLFEFA